MRPAAALLVAASSWLPFPADAEERPRVRLGATYVTDVLTVVDGGERRGTAWLGRADVTASIDRPFGIDGAELFVDVMRVNGPDFSGRYVGDAQTVSNVQADSALRPYEAWIAFPVATGLTAKAGLIDLNTEFDVQEIGRLFLNSSFGIGPDFSQSGQNGPSIFPAPATAAMLRYEGSGWAARYIRCSRRQLRESAPHGFSFARRARCAVGRRGGASDRLDGRAAARPMALHHALRLNRSGRG
jgi:carbohydrate-selective porin OprB